MKECLFEEVEMTIEKRSRRLRQKAEVVRLSEHYLDDLANLRARWGVPPEGFRGNEPAHEWLAELYRSCDTHFRRYHALADQAEDRGWSDQAIGQLVARANREYPLNRLTRNIRNLNERYGLPPAFDRFTFLLWNSHVGDFFAGGVGFGFGPPPCIVITPDLTRRDVEEQWGFVQWLQEEEYGSTPKGGRGRKGRVVIEETHIRHYVVITADLTKSALRREWHRVRAIQEKCWPQRLRREHYKPAHGRRMELLQLEEEVGIWIEEGISRDRMLVTELWEEVAEDETDRRRADLIRQHRRRTHKQMRARE